MVARTLPLGSDRGRGSRTLSAACWRERSSLGESVAFSQDHCPSSPASLHIYCRMYVVPEIYSAVIG